MGKRLMDHIGSYSLKSKKIESKQLDRPRTGAF